MNLTKHLKNLRERKFFLMKRILIFSTVVTVGSLRVGLLVFQVMRRWKKEIIQKKKSFFLVLV